MRPRATTGLPAEDKKQVAELMEKTVQGVWDAIPGTGAMFPTGIVFGVKDAVDPDLSVEDRIKGGAGTTIALAAKYAWVAEQLGAHGFARWAGAYSGVGTFVMTAWELLSMLGRGYSAGHAIAGKSGRRSGMLTGITAAAVWRETTLVKQHLYRFTARDSIPGTFEVTAVKAYNAGFVDAYHMFRSLPAAQRDAFLDGLWSQMDSDVLKDNAYGRFWAHRGEYGNEAQATQTIIALPYVVLSMKAASGLRELLKRQGLKDDLKLDQRQSTPSRGTRIPRSD